MKGRVVENEQEPVELETSRSGRVRKKPKFRQYFARDEESGEDDELDEEDDEFRPGESDGEAENDDAEEGSDDGSGSNFDDDQDGDDLGDGETLPPKKRKRQSKMSRRDIEEATTEAGRISKMTKMAMTL